MAQQSQKPASILSITFYCLCVAFVRGIQIAFCLGILVLGLTERSLATPAEESGIQLTDRIGNLAEVEQGSLLFKGNEDFIRAPVLKTNVKLQVTGMIARVKVEQQFHNISDNWQEGIYVFPLPHDAAVDHMRLRIGERTIEGRIKEREEARKTYEKARRDGKKSALVEQERPNVFTTSVANIAPDEKVVVEIQYQQTVPYEDGIFRLRFPLVVGPRYIPGNHPITGFNGHGWAQNTDEVPDAARITPLVLHPKKGAINPVKLRVDLDAGFELAGIESRYHPVRIEESGNFRYQIELAEGDIPADRDFEITWQPLADGQPRAAFFTESLDNEEYALLMLMPTARNKGKDLERELIFVIDTSGSMAGTSILQARAALKLALESLKPGDRFNIIQFNTVTEQLFRFPQPVSHQSLRQARKYIDRLRAQGGTEMAPAIMAALENSGEIPAVRQVVFLTDGSIGNETALFEIIKNRLGQSRLFTVGIGSAPNSHFMQGAARFGRGTHTFIGKLGEVQSKMETLIYKLEHPVLKDIGIDWSGDRVVETWPQKIPDLYHDQPLLVTFKAERLPDAVTVNGVTAGSTWKQKLQLKGGEKNPGIPVLWARNKIAGLMDERLQNPEADSLRDEIVATALKFHLVSRFTSLVAVDITPARTHDSNLETRPLPVNLPAGWVYEKVFGGMPATATGSYLSIVVGLLLLLLTTITVLLRHDLFRL